MKVLYLGYWSAGDGLTQSVIVPRLEILSGLESVEEIFFCSVEREGNDPALLNLPKVTQLFFHSRQKFHVLMTKGSDFQGLLRMTNECVQEKGISLVICNSPLAGMVGYHLNRNNKVPYVVECFEPHATYMLEAGTWKIWDPRYWILTFYERRQKKTSHAVSVVSGLYSQRLMDEGVPAGKIFTVPNCIPLQEFQFNAERRSSRRHALGIGEHDIVGIYVGKFGDIYYDEEAFDLFAEAFAFFGKNFRLIILTADPKDRVMGKLSGRNLSSERVFVARVPRLEVPDFLSASDFAFSTIRPTPARAFCCPIKNGEYWASGLPVLLEEGIGEDSAIVKEEGGGVLLQPGQSNLAFEQLSSMMKKGRAACAADIFPIAVKHRRMEILSEYYRQLFDQGGF